jgi:hypothetical protein
MPYKACAINSVAAHCLVTKKTSRFRDRLPPFTKPSTVALTLMIAESKPDEKDMMVKVVVNLINIKN